jgi:hypothetical protein
MSRTLHTHVGDRVHFAAYGALAQPTLRKDCQVPFELSLLTILLLTGSSRTLGAIEADQ